MKKLHVSFEGVHDSTGYLFSFARCLSAALRHSPYAEKADDVIAASGFAFRMWVDGKELCPSATSIWAFQQQKPWVENAGLRCEYVERLWHEDALEEDRRMEAIAMIRRSVDNGFAPVAQMLEQGVNICLGTDSAASNNALNLFSEMNMTAMITALMLMYISCVVSVIFWESMVLTIISECLSSYRLMSFSAATPSSPIFLYFPSNCNIPYFTNRRIISQAKSL